MERYYTDERNIQIVISLLKANGIRKIIASPGTTNVTFIGSVQQDPFFEIYSSVDERSAAYIACGLAAESGEAVVLSCTGATASRNYYPGLTEAFYRKLPVLAITSHQGTDRIGHLKAQNIDRRQLPHDIACVSVDIPLVKDLRDERYSEIEANKAMTALFRHGGGPAHINLHTGYSKDFSVRELPSCRHIKYYDAFASLPELPTGNIGVFIGSHRRFTEEETAALDAFCAEHDAVVFCDHTSGYYGKYRVSCAVLFTQTYYSAKVPSISLLIHIGEVSGDYTLSKLKPSAIWRVCADGEIRDTYGKLTAVFEMPASHFFSKYTIGSGDVKKSLADAYRAEIEKVRQAIPELELSNVWLAQQLAPRIPQGSRVHLGILNTLRTWNFFDFPEGVEGYSNVGGFGIDGILSALVGASLVDARRLYFGILGDLSFFYDMNAAGNRHVGNNVRILLVNNGKGAEFRMYNHPASAFGEGAEPYMAAAGHYGKKSPELVRHYAESLGYEYFSASSKEEFLKIKDRFLCPDITDRPMLLEVFTDSAIESEMLKTVNMAIGNIQGKTWRAVADTVKKIIGEERVAKLKKQMGR